MRLTRERDEARAERDAFLAGRLTKAMLLTRAETAEAERDALRALLREAEWGDDVCFACGYRRHQGHAPDCRLKAALEGQP